MRERRERLLLVLSFGGDARRRHRSGSNRRQTVSDQRWIETFAKGVDRGTQLRL